MTEKEQIKVTLLANAGIMIEYNKMKFLIDGIHENTKGIFSGFSSSELSELIQGTIPLYQNIDYLLFTHCHPDHFNADYTEKFLQKNHIRGIFLPDQPAGDFTSLRQLAKSRLNKLWLLDLPLGQKQKIQLTENITVKVFRTIHAGRQFTEVKHYCYLLNFKGKNLVTLADSNYDLDYFTGLLGEEKITAAFVNPLHLHQARGREIINQALDPERLVIYHVPFTNDGKYNLRRMVRRNIERYGDNLPPTDILWNKMQEIYL